MMEEFIQWLKCYLLLSATCDEILSWMIDFWMKISLEHDNNCNTIVLNLWFPKNLQGITYNGELSISVGDTIPQLFTISIEQEN